MHGVWAGGMAFNINHVQCIFTFSLIYLHFLRYICDLNFTSKKTNKHELTGTADMITQLTRSRQREVVENRKSGFQNEQYVICHYRTGRETIFFSTLNRSMLPSGCERKKMCIQEAVCIKQKNRHHHQHSEEVVVSGRQSKEDPWYLLCPRQRKAHTWERSWGGREGVENKS